MVSTGLLCYFNPSTLLNVYARTKATLSWNPNNRIYITFTFSRLNFTETQTKFKVMTDSIFKSNKVP